MGVVWGREGGLFRIYDEPESPNEGGVFDTYNEPGTPNEGGV